MTNESFILQHREDDVRRLALAKFPEGIDAKWCLQQIEGWQLARRKLPRWAATEGLWYPPRLSLEQCSSEQTAEYKRQVMERLMPEGERASMADLTGGLGVDFSYLAPLFQQATYIEVLPHLVELARHNMPLLLRHKGLDIREATTCDRHLSGLSLASQRRAASADAACRYATSFVFLDPARRDSKGQRTYSIADCSPNFIELQDILLTSAQWVMVKLSPMLDIHQALRELHHVCEVHVVSVQGECKELLFLCSAKERKDQPVTFHCANLGTEEDSIEVIESLVNIANIGSLSNLPLFLYEPNASILKAGVQDVLCDRYPVRKLHLHSHLFVGRILIPHFPGRSFRITGWSDFGKKNLKTFISDLRQANLTTRNFPTSVAVLRRQLHLAEGGDVYLFATTQADGQHILIRCEKA